MSTDSRYILDIDHLTVAFNMYGDGFVKRELKVIHDLSLKVRPGKVHAIAGSSGSGKSVLASAVLGLLPANASVSGSIVFNGEELTKERQKKVRGTDIALVPQSVNFLDPLMKVGAQADGHKRPSPSEKRKSLFSRFGLPDGTEKLYPHELSGGMARRVLNTTALLTDASLIIADEPTPGMSLDQAKEALSIFRDLADSGKSVLLITHDIDLAFDFADCITVFYAGTTLETAMANEFREGPTALRHPYSKALWRALPENGFEAFPGSQPYADRLPKGCVFAPRCPFKKERCEEEVPGTREVRGSEVKCFYAE